MRRAAHAAAVACALGACTVNNYNYGQADARGADGAPPGPDAFVPEDPSCGHPLPTNAPATITLKGNVGAVANGTFGPAAGAIVDLVRIGETVPVASASADTSGNFTIVAQTGGRPIDGYLRAHSGTGRDNYAYPIAPYATDASNIPLVIVDQAFYDELAAAGGATQDPAKAFFLAQAVDCDGKQLIGAMFTIDPSAGASIAYPRTDGSGNGAATDTSGEAIINNVAPGPLRIDGVQGTTPLHGHRIDARANAVTIVWVSPS
ncbi:MAG TPA: hypothetical protein VL463_15020 [Kofleriaceae bacterium]|nr:hypothetical protein [Kofleriaceae bacterium]